MIGSQISLWILVLAFMLSTFLLTVVIMDKVTSDERTVGRRVNWIWGKDEEKDKEKDKDSDDKKTTNSYKKQKSAFSKMADMLAEELKKSDILMRPEEFVILWIVIAFVPALLALVISNNYMLPPVLVVIGVIAPIIYAKNKQKKKMKLFDSQLSDALMVCSNCLRSGLTFTQAMENIAEEMDDPISSEFKRVVQEINYGSSQDDALEAMVERVRSADLMLVVSAVNVQRQTGGNLSEILDIIGGTIRERIKIKGEIRSLTAQGRMSGIIIGVLPIAIMLILMVINPSYMSMFFETTTGHMLLAICAVLEMAGFFMINKIVTIKF